MVISILRGGEKSVSELAEVTGIPQANLSQHLTILRQLGILGKRRDGLNIYYSITDERIIQACRAREGCHPPKNAQDEPTPRDHSIVTVNGNPTCNHCRWWYATILPDGPRVGKDFRGHVPVCSREYRKASL